ncbi:predicted protein [Sclerotinia sclerotiorum 1980 UF-70]|uniref:Uncharacterized protein n=1 Tax=Sclerotinia sclerotiorum (strain ATCC 18683 / 1980 / Ss-1) TaxID=665079 RepID=A7EDL6_SCLS1|nr:predicted protein [Sclerotinia sclerotiorum 1980 UF-70]EDO00932.1 predicted protein [Sclerotinia sclerotiorum 1980 UF-70]
MRKETGTAYQAKPLHQRSKRLPLHCENRDGKLRQPSDKGASSIFLVMLLRLPLPSPTFLHAIRTECSI